MRGIRFVALRTIVLALAGACAVGPAGAMSLGNPEVVSYLGQPLRMRVPVILENTSDASGQCVRLINAPAGDVPGLSFGRVELERGADATYLLVSSTLPIGEPILRVAVEVGCLQRVRREFTLFLDPPPTPGGTALAQGAAPPGPPAVEFGPPEVIGHLGQPLLVYVPLVGEAARTVSEACVRPASSASSEPPRVLNDIRVALIDRGGERSLRIHTPEPVNDARVRFIVEVGCDQPTRREFALQIEPPALASLAADQAVAAPVGPAPARAPARRLARAKLPPVLPPAPAAPTPAAEVPAELPRSQPAESRPPEPQRPAPEAAPRADRLVLAPPEDTPRPNEPMAIAEKPRPERPSERELEVLKRVEELAAEVKKLRAELETTNLRNRQLSDRADATSYAWIGAVAAVLLLGVGFLIGARGRTRYREAPEGHDPAGPMTRILGHKAEPARPTAPAAMSAAGGAGPIFADGRRPAAEDTQGASTAIMVTEFGDTTQVIGELYSPYIGTKPAAPEQPGEARLPEPARPRQPTAPSEATTVAGPQTKTEIALDLDLGQERASILSPQTKTEIAVDIDLFERNSQIGRDLQREYERLDLLARKPDPPPQPEPKQPGPGTELDQPTIAGTTTPLTTRLELDLDLSTIGQNPAKPPKKPE